MNNNIKILYIVVLAFFCTITVGQENSGRAIKFQCDSIENNFKNLEGKVLKIWFDNSKNYWMLMSDLHNRLVVLVYPQDNKKQSCIVNFGVELSISDWLSLEKE